MFTLFKQTFSRLRTIKGAISYNRTLYTSSVWSDKFSDSQKQLKTLSDDPGPMIKLQLYGLFKQATEGVCQTKKPGILDVVGGAKWKSWSSLGDMTVEAAKDKYVSLVQSLLPDEDQEVVDSSPDGSTATSSSGHILTSRRAKVHVITLNRPSKMNALTMQMYLDIISSLKEAANNDSLFTVLNAKGNYYCSGNDLTAFMNLSPDQFQEMADKGGTLFRNYIDAFIDHPKPIVALIQGPAVGVAVTVLGLCDLVYASDKATFWTPFTQIGQSVEGCSSYTFPRIMGPAKANEMLLFNEKLSAQQACDSGLITRVYNDEVFETEVWTKLEKYCESAMPNSLKICKNLVRGDREKLRALNKLESETLAKTWLSDECARAIMKFFTPK